MASGGTAVLAPGYSGVRREAGAYMATPVVAASACSGKAAGVTALKAAVRAGPPFMATEFWACLDRATAAARASTAIATRASVCGATAGAAMVFSENQPMA